MPTAPSVLSPVADPTVASSRSSPSTDFDALIERMLELGQITFKKLQKIQTHIESGKYTKEYYVRKWGSKLAKLTKLQAPDAVPPPTTTSKAGEKTKVALVAELAAKRAGTPRARKLDELNELNLTGKSHGTRGDEDQERKEKKKKQKKKSTELATRDAAAAIRKRRSTTHGNHGGISNCSLPTLRLATPDVCKDAE